jgi:phospholipid transport system transporter-binding protein
MSDIAINPMDDGGWRISGELVFATVPTLLAQGPRLFNGQQGLVIDFGGVTRADSAGLALMLEWLEVCRRAGRSLHFRCVPQSLLDIARVSNVSKLLPLTED